MQAARSGDRGLQRKRQHPFQRGQHLRLPLRAGYKTGMVARFGLGPRRRGAFEHVAVGGACAVFVILQACSQKTLFEYDRIVGDPCLLLPHWHVRRMADEAQRGLGEVAQESRIGAAEYASVRRDQPPDQRSAGSTASGR